MVGTNIGAGQRARAERVAWIGAGRMLWPLLAGFFRLFLAAAGGWLATRWLGGGLPALFTAMALAMVVFGLTVATAIGAGGWSRASRS